MNARQPALPTIEYGVSSATLAGEQVCGDNFVVVTREGGTLVGVIDGVGHGSEAARAARVAMDVLEGSAESSVIGLTLLCHDAMKSTRGAVMSLAWFSVRDKNVTFLSVGNVEGILLHPEAQASPARENVLMRGGVVGGNLPNLQAETVPVKTGDLLIFATDGIRSGFDQNLPLSASAQQIADTVCMQYNKGTDDALVLVVRFLGGDS